MGREAGASGLWNVGGGRPGPLYSASSGTGSRGRGEALPLEGPLLHFPWLDGETEAPRGKEVCPGPHSSACPGGRQRDSNGAARGAKTRTPRERKSPEMEAERDGSRARRETGPATWVLPPIPSAPPRVPSSCQQPGLHDGSVSRTQVRGGEGETTWQGDKGTRRGGAAAFPEGCPARRAPEVTPSLALLHSHLSRQFPIQGWPLGLSPSRATSCASVSSSQNGGDSEGTAFRAASQALGANLLPASTPPLQASVPEAPLPSPAPSAAAPGLCPLPSPLLGVRPPPAGRSSAQQSRQPLQRPVCPLVGALWIPLPARDLSQRKSLAAEAGGGPISASWSATLFIILKEEFGRLVWLWQAVGWAPGVSNPSCPPPCTPPARSWAQGA